MGPTTRNGTADGAASRAENIQTRLEAGNDCPLDARQLLDEEEGLTGTPKARSVRHTTTTREVCEIIFQPAFTAVLHLKPRQCAHSSSRHGRGQWHLSLSSFY